MDPVVHFEMPYDDDKRVSKFYQAAFGWNTNALGDEMGSYVLATTTETDDVGPKRPGAINGGFFHRDPKRPAQHPSIVIAVQDIKEAMSRVSAAGGQVLGDPVEITGVGKYVSFYDTEGNRVSMLEPIPRNWHAPCASAQSLPAFRRPSEPLAQPPRATMNAIDLVTDTMRRLTAQGFNPNLAPWEHKVCVMLHAAQGIIDNGGFEYFFEAPFEGSPALDDFPSVFEAVGAHASATALHEAIRRSCLPRPNYDDLNSVLWRESKRNYELLCDYITAHAGSYT